MRLVLLFALVACSPAADIILDDTAEPIDTAAPTDTATDTADTGRQDIGGSAWWNCDEVSGVPAMRIGAEITAEPMPESIEVLLYLEDGTHARSGAMMQDSSGAWYHYWTEMPPSWEMSCDEPTHLFHLVGDGVDVYAVHQP